MLALKQSKFNTFIFYIIISFSKTNETEHFGSFLLSLVLYFQKLHRDLIIKDLSGKPMRAMEIFSIFIKYMTDSLLEAMNKGLDRNEISKSDIDFVLVVPARCGDGAKMFMREAAIKVR